MEKLRAIVPQVTLADVANSVLQVTPAILSYRVILAELLLSVTQRAPLARNKEDAAVR